MTTPVFIDTFSVGLDDLPKYKQRHTATVLRVLAEAGRFSVFEVYESDELIATITRIEKRDYITTDTTSEYGTGYPWTRCELTEAGREYLKKHPAKPKKARRP